MCFNNNFSLSIQPWTWLILGQKWRVFSLNCYVFLGLLLPGWLWIPSLGRGGWKWSLEKQSCKMNPMLSGIIFLLGQFAFSWMENSILLFLFLLLLLFSFLGFVSNFSADDPMQKWMWGRKTERENARPISTHLHLVIICLFEINYEWLCTVSKQDKKNTHIWFKYAHSAEIRKRQYFFFWGKTTAYECNNYKSHIHKNSSPYSPF